jgi:hypothetical protein
MSLITKVARWEALMNHFTHSQYTAFIGIDWADTKHDICLQTADSEHREFTCLPHQVADIEEWARSLRQRFGGPIAIALELSKGPIVYALQKYDFLVLFPINPSTLAKYREACTPSRAKDDPSDAELALDLLLCHPDRFQPLQPQSVELRALATLVEQRMWNYGLWPLWSNSAETWSMTGCGSPIDCAVH